MTWAIHPLAPRLRASDSHPRIELGYLPRFQNRRVPGYDADRGGQLGVTSSDTSCEVYHAIHYLRKKVRQRLSRFGRKPQVECCLAGAVVRSSAVTNGVARTAVRACACRLDSVAA